MHVDASGWSGEGEFTQIVIERLKRVEAITAIRVEDAPASRTDADYNFVSNEIFVVFARSTPARPRWRLGFRARGQDRAAKAMTVA